MEPIQRSRRRGDRLQGQIETHRWLLQLQHERPLPSETLLSRDLDELSRSTKHAGWLVLARTARQRVARAHIHPSRYATESAIGRAGVAARGRQSGRHAKKKTAAAQGCAASETRASIRKATRGVRRL